MINATSFFRSDFNHPFTSEEKEMKDFISPLMAEAHNINIFIHQFGFNRLPGAAAAICDIKGILRESEPAFSDLILSEWPEWLGPELNFMPEDILNGAQEAQFQGTNIVIDLSLQNDLVLLLARPKGIIDSLTPSENQITQQLMKGFTNKEIGKSGTVYSLRNLWGLVSRISIDLSCGTQGGHYI